ncbi:hypothetical protein GOP47_0008953 [Adiantum capillus-veneris]|uniref:Uncharacterized protein n=1 Tax=Adiantum capillus-veneris TaxID=13818 RepID=A0A9D4UZI8_ADICA|nr:hypothetical protein GOP47_0008953 [Adiantum capillus-veneris]
MLYLVVCPPFGTVVVSNGLHDGAAGCTFSWMINNLYVASRTSSKYAQVMWSRHVFGKLCLVGSCLVDTEGGWGAWPRDYICTRDYFTAEATTLSQLLMPVVVDAKDERASTHKSILHSYR